jgi:hypothetical protein
MNGGDRSTRERFVCDALHGVRAARFRLTPGKLRVVGSVSALLT